MQAAKFCANGMQQVQERLPLILVHFHHTMAIFDVSSRSLVTTCSVCVCMRQGREKTLNSLTNVNHEVRSYVRFVQCQQGICLRENSHVFTSKGTDSQVGLQAWDASSQEPHALFAWFSTYVSPKQSGSQRSLQERLVAWAVIIWPRYEPGNVVVCTCIVTNLKVFVCTIYIYSIYSKYIC